MQHSLSVIARPRLLCNSYLDFGDKTSEQNCALHLRARCTSVPIDASQIDAAHSHRQPVTMLEIELRPHVSKGLGDALHRAPTETLVTIEARREWMSGDYSGNESYGRSAIPAVECAARL